MALSEVCRGFVVVMIYPLPGRDSVDKKDFYVIYRILLGGVATINYQLSSRDEF